MIIFLKTIYTTREYVHSPGLKLLTKLINTLKYKI